MCCFCVCFVSAQDAREERANPWDWSVKWQWVCSAGLGCVCASPCLTCKKTANGLKSSAVGLCVCEVFVCLRGVSARLSAFMCLQGALLSWCCLFSCIYFSSIRCLNSCDSDCVLVHRLACVSVSLSVSQSANLSVCWSVCIPDACTLPSGHEKASIADFTLWWRSRCGM